MFVKHLICDSLMSHFKQCISNEFLPSVPSCLILSFLLCPLFSLEISFSCFFLRHVQLFQPCLLKHYSLSNHLSLFLCQNSTARILVILYLISLWHSSTIHVFKFIPHLSDFCKVGSITANHRVLFSSSSLWATQSLLHSYVVWTLGVNIQKKVLLQFCLGLCWI